MARGSPEKLIAKYLPNLDVSHETIDRLKLYVSLIKKWQKTINLVGPKTVPDIWQRHIIDSLQLVPIIHHKMMGINSPTIVDLGSGGGLPALVTAIALPNLHVIMIEQDKRKAAFLRTVSREIGLDNTTIIAEDFSLGRQLIDDSITINGVTARAVTALEQLIPLARLYLGDTGWMLFPKGETWQAELNVSRETFKSLTFQPVSSVTHPEAKIILCQNTQ